MFGRSKKLPSALTPALDREERVLTWARVSGAAPSSSAVPSPSAASTPSATDAGAERVIVATNRGLWLPGAEARLGWHEIHKATWGDGRLTVTGSTGKPAGVDGNDFSVVSDLTPVSFRLDDPGMLPRRVQERVTASVAVSSLHRLPGQGSVRVVARRVSGVDGLAWSVRFEGGASDDDPAAAVAAAELVAAAKSEIAPVD